MSHICCESHHLDNHFCNKCRNKSIKSSFPGGAQAPPPSFLQLSSLTIKVAKANFYSIKMHIYAIQNARCTSNSFLSCYQSLYSSSTDSCLKCQTLFGPLSLHISCYAVIPVNHVLNCLQSPVFTSEMLFHASLTMCQS